MIRRDYMERSLLDDIYDIGENLASALINADLDRYFELVDKRGTLLECLGEYQHPSEIDADWREMWTRLQEQHEFIMATLAAHEMQMQEALGEFERFKGASRTYQRSNPRRQILDSELRV